MNGIYCFVLALKSLATSKMRAFLTMLGIIIGVAAVIIIMSLGNGITGEVSDAFDALGTNTITVSVRGRGSTRSVSDDDMFELKTENPDAIAAISPTVTVGAQVKIGTESYTPSITGVAEDYIIIKAYEMGEGRFLNYIDSEAAKTVCVVGAYYNSAEAFDGNALGNTLRINGYQFTVVGVVDRQSDDWEDEDSGDNFVLVPYTTASKLLMRNAQISSYTVLSTDEDHVSEAKSAVETRLYKAFGNTNAYSVIAMSEILDSVTGIMDTLVMGLAYIAALSLLVGGIGIMNIMLVSVTERTREIGIRKALGAKPKHIKMQFVIEAGTTSALGGVIGIILGIIVSGVVGNLLDITCEPTIFSICVSFGVSVVIGVLFGFLPANKAAKLNPIDALRND